MRITAVLPYESSSQCSISNCQSLKSSVFLLLTVIFFFFQRCVSQDNKEQTVSLASAQLSSISRSAADVLVKVGGASTLESSGISSSKWDTHLVQPYILRATTMRSRSQRDLSKVNRNTINISNTSVPKHLPFCLLQLVKCARFISDRLVATENIEFRQRIP